MCVASWAAADGARVTVASALMASASASGGKSAYTCCSTASKYAAAWPAPLTPTCGAASHTMTLNAMQRHATRRCRLHPPLGRCVCRDHRATRPRVSRRALSTSRPAMLCIVKKTIRARCVNIIMQCLYVSLLRQHLSGLDSSALSGVAPRPEVASTDLREGQRHLSQVRSNVRIYTNTDGRMLPCTCALRPCG